MPNDSDENRKNMNIATIAEALNVSKTTVSRAISGKGRIGEATRARVLAYIDKHDYRPNLMARGLAQSKTFNIALVIGKRFSSLDLPFLRKSMRAVCETAAQRDYDVLLVMAGDRDIRPLNRLLNNHKMDGVVLTRTIENDPMIPLLRQADVPFVVFGNESADVLQVDNDQVGGSRELTLLLLLKGYRRLALLGGDEQYIVNRSRLDGYVQAHRQLGVPVDGSLISLGLESDIQRISGIDAALDKRPDCLLCMDDVMTQVALNRIEKRGLHIPQDIRIASLYDADALEEQNPQVTAVRYNATQLGSTATTLLLDKLDGRDVPTITIQGYQVMMRGSTT